LFNLDATWEWVVKGPARSF